VKDRNDAKEARSTNQLKADRAMDVLTNLDTGLCPIVNDLNAHVLASSISSSGGGGGVVYMQFTVAEVRDAFEIISAVPYAPAEDGAESEEIAILKSIGVFHLLVKWRSQLGDFLSAYDQWYAAAQAYYEQHSPKVVAMFDVGQVAVLETISEGLRQVWAQCEEAFHKRVPKDTQGFYVFLDTVNWMLSFLQVGFIFCKYVVSMQRTSASVFLSFCRCTDF
jgi:hypothetical protein